MTEHVFGWDYPAGAENDPRAPYNQPDEDDNEATEYAWSAIEEEIGTNEGSWLEYIADKYSNEIQDTDDDDAVIEYINKHVDIEKEKELYYETRKEILIENYWANYPDPQEYDE